MNHSFFPRRCRKGSIWLLPVFSLFLFLFPIVGRAEEGTLSFYVTPEFSESQVAGSHSYFDMNLAAGATETLALKIQNASSEAIQVQVTPHTAYTN
ncbi:WxL protein peptidoglycan domain-containing protein, partial [Enterococcus casseliflavus]|uniref:WxL protein peptidoglycan domain-containing protein n=1 Tax=Enterococcus casseliflavus TaxID=37734 RepID=UPI003DA5951D